MKGTMKSWENAYGREKGQTKLEEDCWHSKLLPQMFVRSATKELKFRDEWQTCDFSILHPIDGLW